MGLCEGFLRFDASRISLCTVKRGLVALGASVYLTNELTQAKTQTVISRLARQRHVKSFGLTVDVLLRVASIACSSYPIPASRALLKVTIHYHWIQLSSFQQPSLLGGCQIHTQHRQASATPPCGSLFAHSKGCIVQHHMKLHPSPPLP